MAILTSYGVPKEKRYSYGVPTRSKPARDLGLHLHYAFEPGEQSGASLGNPLFELLAAVAEGGSIRHAAQRLGTSYRHAWGALRHWEGLLGEPVITWSKGQRARLTPFAEKLLWGERRVRLHMQPHIESLRADLAEVLAVARDERHQVLRVRASHDLALPILQQHVGHTDNLHLDIGFEGSADALRSLNARQCLVAGFHVPASLGAAPVFSRALKPLLEPGSHRLIAYSNRMQGLMVRREHAQLIRTFSDVATHGLRFANRQPGSGTRLLVDHLIHEHSIPAHLLQGYHNHIEHSHVAVALCVASGVVDAAIGVEAAALPLGLHFVPLIEESYFLACLVTNLGHPAIQRLRTVLAGPGWQKILAGLPGYQPPAAPGSVLTVESALPWWRRSGPKPVYQGVERQAKPEGKSREIA
jgi:putative molybdopterin biosynthesis protein